MDIQERKKFLKGTTTVGLVCSDGVVLGADTRATMDTFIASSEARKVWKIDENLAMTIAGSVGDAQELIRILKAQNEIYKMNENRPLSPKSATSLLSIIMQENKMLPFFAELIIGGVDGSPSVFTIDMMGGYIEESNFASTGSGSLTALGYLEDMYKKGVSVKDGVKGVVRALTIAMRRDSATGDNMIIATITKSGGYTEYAGKDLEKLLSSK